MDFFFFQNILQDRSTSLGLFRKGNNHFTCIAKFHRTDVVICSQSREGKTPSDSQINMVIFVIFHYSTCSAETAFEGSQGDICHFQSHF